MVAAVEVLHLGAGIVGRVVRGEIGALHRGPADLKERRGVPTVAAEHELGQAELAGLPADERGLGVIARREDGIGARADIKDNERKMRDQIKKDSAEMLESAGFKNVKTFDNAGGLGVGVHEMGTARMGKDPKTSVLNGNNQLHTVPNVFVTDGACMTSASCVNPSITYMALTARAAHFAVNEMKRRNL